MNMALDSVAASCHSHMLATAARDGSVTVFNIEKQSMVASRNIDCKVSYWHLSQPQNSSVVGADYTHTQCGGREEGGRIQAEIQHTDWVTDMAMCQTTQSLVTTSNDKYKELMTKASELIVFKK
jgi:hypothetical protein